MCKRHARLGSVQWKAPRLLLKLHGTNAQSLGRPKRRRPPGSKRGQGLRPPPAAGRCAPRCAPRLQRLGGLPPRSRSYYPRCPAPVKRGKWGLRPAGRRTERVTASGATVPGPPCAGRGGCGKAAGSGLASGLRSARPGRQPTESPLAGRQGGRANSEPERGGGAEKARQDRPPATVPSGCEGARAPQVAAGPLR